MSTPTTTFSWSVSTMDRQLSNGAVQTVHYMKAVKALQEAMDRIETLEQRLSDAGIA